MEDLGEIKVPGSQQSSGPKNLPNSSAVLTLGIISIVTCWLFGVVGIVCGIIAISLHGKDKRIYQSDPASYEQSYKNSQAGFICGIIGLCMSGIAFFAGIVNLITEGF